MSTTIQTQRPQHLQALESANEVRVQRAALKRQIASGEASVAEILDPANDLPWVLGNMTVFELLMAQPYWGRRRVLKFLAPVAIAEHRRVGTLTARERSNLALALEGGRVRDQRLLAA